MKRHTIEIFGMNRSTVYAGLKGYRETDSTEPHTSQRGRKSKLTSENYITSARLSS